MTTDIQTLDPVARFHRALVEEILRTHPTYLNEPFTVAEIYQNLVPYRSHRDRIGVEMNGDYEDALLRLLAGEGEYLVLESEHAVREIREELASSNPNTGLYRAYAAADVRLNPQRTPRDVVVPIQDLAETPAAPAASPFIGLDSLITELELPRSDTPPPPAEPLAARAAKPAAPSAKAPAPAAPVSPGAKSPAVAKAAAPAKAAVPTNGAKASAAQTSEVGSPAQTELSAVRDGPASACHWCREPLPRRDVLNFCPFCGGNVHTAPCSNCGEELEVRWKFCVTCGTAAGERG